MEESPRLDGVLLDFDGTLVRLGVDWSALRRGLQALFSPLGFQSRFTPLSKCLREAEEAMEERYGPSFAARVMTQAWEILRMAELNGASTAVLLPGVVFAWRWLKERGIPVAIVSNNHGAAIRAALSVLELELPEVIVGRDEVRKPKADPEGARLAMARVGLTARGTWMVGDSHYDMEVGKALGLHVALVGNRGAGADGGPEDGILRVEQLDDLVTVWSAKYGFR